MISSKLTIFWAAALLVWSIGFPGQSLASAGRKGKISMVSQSQRHGHRHHHEVASEVRTKRKTGRWHKIARCLGSRRKHSTISHRGERSGTGRKPKKHRVVACRHAYPLNFFMMHAPDFDRQPVPQNVKDRIRLAFLNGYDNEFPANALVKAGLVVEHPLRGGIFWRREPVKYVVIHSTETGVPQSAPRVIDSWSSLGRRHAGAQYVVDRDGTIYEAVDPDLATVHVNIFKTLPGINNDNSIGIEMVHAGRQTYTPEQRSSVIRLVSYLQDRYSVADENVITHRYAQQGDHTDPVAFDWEAFLSDKGRYRTQAMACRLKQIKDQSGKYSLDDVPVASTYLQLRGKLAADDENAGIKHPAHLSSAPLSVNREEVCLGCLQFMRPINPSLPFSSQSTDNTSPTQTDQSTSNALPPKTVPVTVGAADSDLTAITGIAAPLPGSAN